MIIEEKEIKINEIRKALNKHKSVKVGNVVISNIPKLRLRVYDTTTGKIRYYNSLELILEDYNYFEKNKQMSIL